jgi:hypothetical protein
MLRLRRAHSFLGAEMETWQADMKKRLVPSIRRNYLGML